ncbi:MAG: hypothetical protein AB7D19_07865 [Acetobacter sp.]|uniref:tetratricopeptide repeat protein n=1 Tax=Acetobacter sp. TaxID=440 RepID=UPI003D0117F5
MSEDLFREVDDALRTERLRRVAWRYAGLAAAAVLVAGGAAGGWAWHVSQLNTARQKATGAYLTALNQTGNLPMPMDGATTPTALSKTAQEGLDTLRELGAQAPGGVAVMARLQEAGMQAARGDTKAALTAWDSVQADESAPRLLRDLASLLWCRQQLDTANPAELRSRLSVLSGKDQPWYGLATEALALLDVREGHIDDARRKFAALMAQPDLPSGVRSRAQDMMQALDPSAG